MESADIPIIWLGASAVLAVDLPWAISMRLAVALTDYGLALS